MGLHQLEKNDDHLGSLEVTGTGDLKIANTGGSSASEGGMGSDGDSEDKEKGELTRPGESNQKSSGKSQQQTSTGGGDDSYESKVKEETEKASNRSV